MYNERCKKWLMALIKQRKLLIRQSKSLKPQHEAEESIRKLEMYLGTYNYSNENMAKFMISKSALIVTIMPGSGSTCRQKRLQEYSELIGEGKILLRKTKQYELSFG